MGESTLYYWIIPIAGLTAVLFAFYLARDVLARDTGTPEMEAVAGTIYEGAVAFIKRQYTTIAVLAVVACGPDRHPDRAGSRPPMSPTCPAWPASRSGS